MTANKSDSTLCHACKHSPQNTAWVRVYLTDDQWDDLIRFRDSCLDDGTFSMSSMKRRELAHLGLLRWRGQSRWDLTELGRQAIAVHENRF